MKRKQARISAPVSCPVMPRRWLPPDRHLLLRLGLHRAAGLAAVGLAERRQVDQRPVGAPLARCVHGDGGRSEEHTSELQSLMRISYAAFCLKKKRHKTQL